MSEQVIDKATDAGAATGGLISFIVGVTFNEWIGLVGVLFAGASFGVNFWHKRRMVQLRQQEVDQAKGGK